MKPNISEDCQMLLVMSMNKITVLMQSMVSVQTFTN